MENQKNIMDFINKIIEKNQKNIKCYFLFYDKTNFSIKVICDVLSKNGYKIIKNITNTKSENIKDIIENINKNANITIIDTKSLINNYNNKQEMLDDLLKYKENSIIINLDYIPEKTMSHILIKADFERFDFTQLEKENNNKKYKGIKWQNYTTYKDQEGNFIKVKGQQWKYNINDNVYIYYSNLPNYERRILLKGRIINNGFYDENYNVSEIYYDDEEDPKGDKKRPAILIDIIGGQKLFDVKDENKFTKEVLENKYKLDVSHQGNSSLDSKKYEQLVKDLDKSFEKEKDILQELIKYFRSNCELDGLKIQGKNSKDELKHPTFNRRNGTRYFEYHHLLKKEVIKRKDNNGNEKSNKDIKNKSYNICRLCPTCHNRIHKGKKEDIEQMVRKLYEIKNKNGELAKLVKEHFKESKDYSNKKFDEDEALNFILSTYLIDK